MDETPPREGERELDVLPRKGEHEVDVPLQGIPNEGKSGGGHETPRNSERNTLPQRDPKMGALEIWDLGGKPPGGRTVEGKGPVEASKSNRGQRRLLRSKTWSSDMKS